ncbi:hypothetical protein DSUL_20148 [Desulfovibrionales bacterium]
MWPVVDKLNIRFYEVDLKTYISNTINANVSVTKMMS